MIDQPTPIPTIYHQRAAKRAKTAIAAGVLLALLCPAVILFELLVAEPQDRDYLLVVVFLLFTAAGVWNVRRGLDTLRRNKADMAG